ncbi:precorrin-6Y C5,15-methyltransferase (decarboxylating) subunit CbiT [Pseudaestuariivita atlantica]|uniref:Precorrin-6Y methyltransferase n=1 Tax=Pseudaestuariivita atlantica TaxID=1317121 RepID=A0A0L1JRL7_9RHOB|nr:precorrin-6Y C5,15-methyltransferase (decarboxylating) subunit CbiT [Pseudaestuariivita atlantica]KNG94028.1 precorrin-6Y methyltransferase [Pseudaestuariivita atlantica]
MADPWLTLIGLGEDGPAGLSDASRAALAAAEQVFGAPRHLALAGVAGTEWPVPFSTAPLLACRGRPTVALVSGDPFWFGAGGSLMADLAPGEWVAHPAPSVFQWVAARLGWRMEDVACRGLHAAPMATLARDLAPGGRLICTLRDGAAVAELAAWLVGEGYGASLLTVCEAVGGPRERVRALRADAEMPGDIGDLVAAAVALDGPARAMLPGRAEDAFDHDGQISKRHVRALTVMALAPRPGAHLWDLGAGSGAISVEWCLAARGATADAVEAREDRVDTIRANAARYGVARHMAVHHAILAPPYPLPDRAPDAVFIGGGASAALIDEVWDVMPRGTRLVINAVTLETETLVMAQHAARGGTLTRIEIAQTAPLGGFRGWTPARPVVQWSVAR